MAYTPINWQTGDTITAEKMNKMDNGWSVETTQYFSETVTTVAGQMGNSAQLAYTGTDFPESMNITFDGTDYVCPEQDGDGRIWYGASRPADWSQYPFILLFMNGTWLLITETAGEHTISASDSSLNVSDDFKSVVDLFVWSPLLFNYGTTTFAEVWDAFTNGKIIYRNIESGTEYTCEIILTANRQNYTVYAVQLNFDHASLYFQHYTADSYDGALS